MSLRLQFLDFLKKIGFNSFQELKLAIHATDSTRNDEFFSELSPTDDYKEILTKKLQRQYFIIKFYIKPYH